MMYAEPETLHLLLDKLADSVILYLNAQIRAGAQSVMIFDTCRRGTDRARLSRILSGLYA